MITTLLWMLAACESPEIGDDPLPDDKTGPKVGVGAMQFYEQVPKNIIFMSIDTFRKDHIGAYGSTQGLTPFLDRIAREGVVFTDHQQCSNWSYASTTCTLAGRTNIERGHMPRLSGSEETRTKVPEGTPFLATWLGQQGYASALISANDWLSPSWGNTQGFGAFAPPGGDSTTVGSKGREIIQQQLTETGRDRFFLHMHHMEPHASYDPPEEFTVTPADLDPWLLGNLRDRDMHYNWRNQWGSLDAETQELLDAHLRVLYEGEIRTIDDRLRRNWEMFEAEGYLNDTLVLIWNDHGEQFWEHGEQTHAFTLHGEENDGFLIAWSRNIVEGRHDGPTHAIDIVPSLLAMIDAPMPAEVTGEPFGLADDDRMRFSEAMARSGGVNMVTQNGLKLHYRWNGSVEFYDRNVDPGELNDLYDPTDPRVLALWGPLRQQAEAMAPLILGDPAPQPSWPAGLP
jgi:arylsulfatase A-like enzyme